MRFEKGTEVFTATGEKIGTISRIVIDVKTRDVTDLVVDRGLLAGEEKVVPVGLIDLENEDRIMLRETNQTVDDLTNYETSHYVASDETAAPYENVRTSYWYPPVDFQTPIPRNVPAAVPDRPVEPVSSIPEGRVAIAEGAKVVSADDHHIGNVEQVITNSATNTVTHFVIGKGFLLKEHKLVPTSWVSDVSEEKIQLSVDSGLFDRLPDYHRD
jgi:uncharacterized protein YrrD